VGTTLGRDLATRTLERPLGLLRRPEIPPDDDAPEGAALLAFPVTVFVVWRLVHAFVVIAVGGAPVASAFLFDATYYLAIVDHGYVITDPTYHDFQTVAFFPAFPVVAYPFVTLLGTGLGGTLVANILALAAFVAVWAAARRWYDERTARLALITLACWPGSLFLWAFYSEALFVAVTAGALWADRSGRARLAAVLVLVAGLTRSPGLLLGPVLVAVHLWERRRFDRPALAYGLATAAAVGGLVVLGRVVADDPLALSHAQLAWGRALGPPWLPLTDGARHIVDSLPRLAGETAMNVAATVLFLALGVWRLVRARRRSGDEPVAPALWTLAATGMPLFTALMTSMVRLVVGAWTGFVLLALILRDRPVLRWGLWVGTAAVSVVLLRRLSQGAFVA
jgi:hypothetical protein